MGGSASVAEGSKKTKETDSKGSPGTEKKSEKKPDAKSDKKKEVKPPINYFDYTNVYFNEDERKEVLSLAGPEDVAQFNQVVKVATQWMVALQNEYSVLDPENDDAVLKFACTGEGHEELMTPKKAGSTKYLTCVSMLFNASTYFDSNDFGWKIRQCLRSKLGDLFTEHELYPILINCLRCIEKMPWVKLDRRLGTKAADYKLYWPLKNTLGLLSHYAFYVREADVDHVDELVQFCYQLVKTKEEDYRTKKTMEDEERVLRNCLNILEHLTFTSSMHELLRSTEFISCAKAYSSDKAPGLKVSAICLVVAALQDVELGRAIVDIKAVETLVVGIQQLLRPRDRKNPEEEARFYGWDMVNLVNILKKISVNTNYEGVVQRLGVAIDPLKKVLASSEGGGGERRGYESDDSHQEGGAGDENDRITLAALETLAMMSFHEELCDKLRENSFTVKLKNLAKHRKQEVKATAKGLLEKLGGEQIHAPPVKPLTPSGHVMISYCHTNISKVWPVKSGIESLRYNVWIDQQNQQHVSENQLDAIPDAIDKASVVVIFISEQYKQCFRCRREAEYALRMKKRIIYVKVDSEFKPSKWHGLVVSDDIDVSGKRPFDGEMQKVKRRLVEQSGSSTSTGTHDHQSDSVTDAWREKHNLTKNSKYKGIQLGELKFLKGVYQRAPEFFFRYVETKLKLQTWSEIAEFENALRDPVI